MSHKPARLPALLRGSAAGLLTAALTLAAHGLGGGALPPGPAAVQLLIVAVTVGAVGSAVPRAGDVRVMLALLGAGQLVGHGILAAAGHAHTPAVAAPGWTMASAHLAAVALGAVLISLGDRLCRTVSRTLRRSVRYAARPVASPPGTAAIVADQPLHATLVLVSSLSHRGPPVGAAR